MKLRKIVVWIFAGILTFGLASCSDTPSSGAGSSKEPLQTQTTAEAEYPIVIQHAFGETVIKSKPERVATIAWANQDAALALGVVPVGFSEANYGMQDDSGVLPWTAEKLKELGVTTPNVFRDTDGLDFEAISECKPDVILAAYSGITQEDYDLLSQIAPVVAYPKTAWATTWREMIVLNAAGMGRKAEGEQLVAELETLIHKQAELYPQMKGITVAWVNFSAKDLSKFHLYTPIDPRGAFLIELGMQYPESITSQMKEDTGYSLSFSAENADVLQEVDIIIGYGDENLLTAVQADPLLGTIPAVKRGSVFMIGNGTTLAASGTPGPLSIPYTIDEYVSSIMKAIEKVNG